MSKSSSFVSGKRRRGTEDEVYLDNYQSHKRYLTEVMASSMNGLSVNDSGAANRRPSSPLVDVMISPTPTDTVCTLSRSASSFQSQGEETSTLDSLMSEESDESMGYRFSSGSDVPHYSIPFTFDLASNQVPSSSSPSPRRFQRLLCHNSSQVSPAILSWMPTSKSPTTPHTTAWPRFPTTEGRLPPSPNDPSQAPDLRRATLLRNLSLRTQLPAQPTSSCTTPDQKAENNLNELESLEKDSHQLSLNSMSCHYFEYAPEQVGCNTSIMGSPTHGIFPSHVVRGSPRVRSLVLGETTVRPKELMKIDVSTSNAGEETRANLSLPSRFEDGVSYNRSGVSPRSPHSLKTILNSPDYDQLLSKDGNVSDTESSFSRSASRTSLSRQQSVCSPGDSTFSVLETRAINPVTRIP